MEPSSTAATTSTVPVFEPVEDKAQELPPIVTTPPVNTQSSGSSEDSTPSDTDSSKSPTAVTDTDDESVIIVSSPGEKHGGSYFGESGDGAPAVSDEPDTREAAIIDEEVEGTDQELKSKEPTNQLHNDNDQPTSTDHLFESQDGNGDSIEQGRQDQVGEAEAPTEVAAEETVPNLIVEEDGGDSDDGEIEGRSHKVEALPIPPTRDLKTETIPDVAGSQPSVELDTDLEIKEDDDAALDTSQTESNEAQRNIVEEIWESIFTPGVNERVRSVINMCFVGLFLSLGSLAIATKGNIHVLALMGIAGGLFFSLQWFLTELAKLPPPDAANPSDPSNTTPATGSKEIPIQAIAPSAISSTVGGEVAASAEEELVESKKTV
ncbi:hypothetical protein HDV00_008425 [Rhizophlyctis rosea]|nr:hypothetical protein HDV00_008425 [Rhizophlyctis rosea]